MTISRNSEVGAQRVNERKRNSDPRPKPTVKQLFDKYTSRKANNVFSRLGGTKLQGLLLDLGGMSAREKIYINNDLIFQYILRGASIHGRHII
jgi:hypothetical protein